MLTRVQVRMARAALGWGMRELAQKAELNPNSVSRFENGGDMRSENLRRIQRAFEEAGIEFIPENGGGPGVRLKEREM